MTLTDPEIFDLADDLLATWRERDGEPFEARSRRTIRAQQLAVVFGLASHTYYIGADALHLLRSGRVLASLPLVRAAYEASMTAQWVAQTTDGFLAFIHEESRQRVNLAKAMESAVSEVFRDAAASVVRPEFALPATDASARRFDQVCSDLQPGGADAYVIYRSLSHQSHASVLVADQYLDASDGAVSFSLTPKEPSTRPWLFLVASSFIWAGRAVDFFDGKHVRRKQLREAARLLGAAPVLHLTDQALLRDQAVRMPRRGERPAKKSPRPGEDPARRAPRQ